MPTDATVDIKSSRKGERSVKVTVQPVRLERRPQGNGPSPGNETYRKTSKPPGR